MLERIPVLLSEDEASLPRCGREGDAGYDIRSTVSADIEPFERFLVPTGIKMAIPEGYAALVVPRSGLAVKHGISIVNSPGLIDSNYRGEIKVILVNLDPRETFHIEPGDRIAQLLFVKAESPQLDCVDMLPESNRGEQGFGSSGVE